MRDLLTEIWESVRRNKLRTCLTGFAVSWGIFMIIVLVGAGNGLLNSFNQTGDDVATNTMEVGGGVTTIPYDGLKVGRRIRLEESDMDLLRRDPFSRYVDQVSTNYSVSGYQIVYGNYNFLNCSLCGVYAGYDEMNRVSMLAGRFINEFDDDEHRKVAVITHIMAKTLLGGKADYESLLGKRIRVNEYSLLVVGVRKASENQDDRDVFVPYSTLKSIFGLDNKIDQFTFTFHGLETEEENEAFENNLRTSINSAHRAAPEDRSAVWIWNRFTQNMQMEKGSRILNIALWIIGIFTLLGGIVGVSNIMLITVKERTHEFGIRKAIGARPWNIMELIVAESVAITGFFGYIGMALGMMACYILDKTVGQSSLDLFGESIQLLVNPTVGIDVALEATLLLVVAGTLAGIVPARQASRVRPIEALNAV